MHDQRHGDQATALVSRVWRDTWPIHRPALYQPPMILSTDGAAIREEIERRPGKGQPPATFGEGIDVDGLVALRKVGARG